ncbi:hypothetical protein L1987_48027 [Smallanthus sonchifolius]|uniref:Uncharacterized protein n=1 Tax=Smallanthus sonchifolius TaxID=185202 RepID=A0ACB9FQV5_9ASTR|nr:hypothetical protein L1987_48027 [Smallanthus sonchifolius]
MKLVSEGAEPPIFTSVSEVNFVAVIQLHKSLISKTNERQGCSEERGRNGVVVGDGTIGDAGGLFSKTRYKFWAIAAILLRALWARFTGSVTLKWSGAGNVNNPLSDSFNSPVLDLHILVPIYLGCWSGLDLKSLWWCGGVGCRHDEEGFRSEIAVVVVVRCHQLHHSINFVAVIQLHKSLISKTNERQGCSEERGRNGVVVGDGTIGDAGGLFSKTRYKFWAIAAILLRALWARFTGSVTLKWSGAGNVNNPLSDSFNSPVRDLHILVPIYLGCWSGLDLKSLWWCGGVGCRHDEEGFRSEIAVVVVVRWCRVPT